ncbi:universal bacterial protein YeaZ [Clostridium sp. CAG:122]|uniref:tRNA (adenosine(37)-N6)-threonylcarbamoyltransferase complex dimerization subunit type 1 TsaB n=1 Tax=Butyribacter TaxID=2822463 RepID=UPI00033DCF52|nr:universal bacterial protein YeaZ [Clostridium sp. CAG:122]
MKILGIDSSGLVASAAIADEKNIIAEFTVNNKQTHSQTLLPMIEKVVDMSGIELEQIDAIAIAAGPGSFTGLRIGSATAKGIGLALKKPIVSVPTLEGIAYRVSVFDGLICPIMDARRGQVYTGIYKADGDGLTCLSEQKAVDIHDILKELEEYDEKVIFLGDGVEVHRETIENELKNEFVFAPVHLSKQSAAAVAVLGSIYFEQGKAESADEHKPIYLRKSQAEREREERLKNQG